MASEGLGTDLVRVAFFLSGLAGYETRIGHSGAKQTVP